MNSEQEIVFASVILLLSAASSLGLAAVVLYNNPAKKTHRLFSVICINLAVWALGVYFIIRSHDTHLATQWIQWTFAVSVFLPANTYHFITYFPNQRFEGRKSVVAILYLSAILLVLGINTPWYIVDVRTFHNAPPQVVYGWVFSAFIFPSLVCLLGFVGNLVSKLRLTMGIQRRQIEYLLVFFVFSLSGAVLTNVAAPIAGISNLEHYGPCFVLVMMAGLAYTMVRYQLMDIRVFISRTTVYAVTTFVVALVFFGAVSTIHYFFSDLQGSPTYIGALPAALIVVLLLQPLKERFQLLLDRFMVSRRYDANALISRVSRRASHALATEDLLRKVCWDIRQTMGIARVQVVQVDEHDAQRAWVEYSTQELDIGNETQCYEPLLEYFVKYPKRLILEEIVHARPTREQALIAQCMAEEDIFVAFPLQSSESLMGVLMLGQKDTRDIYAKDDIKVLSTLADGLTTALENLRLYRQLKAANLHLESILENMRGGVTAVDMDGQITTVNTKAREWFGEGLAAGQSLESVSEPVRGFLQRTLKRLRGIPELETTVITTTGEELSVSLSTSLMDSPDGESLGAVALIHDLTQIKRLESNVQRADRLSSIGIMAAGMAHEIKNPLQSIRTFTQLLPKRFDDEDFRQTFLDVIPPEVTRIDNIVRRLLDFARPKPTNIVQQDLREVIHDVLALTDNELSKKNIQVEIDFPEQEVRVSGDEQQLHQVLLNLVLNAIAAMNREDERFLRFRIWYDRVHLLRHAGIPQFDVECVKLAIADTGCGISEEGLRQLFTPFYTTKDDGSGLGLAVVHGIVNDHGGQIEVSSKLGEGAVFTVALPLPAIHEPAERVSS